MASLIAVVRLACGHTPPAWPWWQRYPRHAAAQLLVMSGCALIGWLMTR